MIATTAEPSARRITSKTSVEKIAVCFLVVYVTIVVSVVVIVVVIVEVITCDDDVVVSRLPLLRMNNTKNTET